MTTPLMRARDLMQTGVTVIRPDESVREALSLIIKHHVGGLPVVDPQGRCIGVVTSTDILSYEEHQTELSEQSGHASFPYFDPETQRWESISAGETLDELPSVPVIEVMTPHPVAVHPDTPLEDVAEKMLEAHVQRILVLDDDRRLHGIISSMDFVRLYTQP